MTVTRDHRLDGHEAAPAVRADRDADYEIQREAVVAMLERERRSLTSSLLALALLAVAISFLPDRRFMFALLAARIASFLFTRWSAGRLEMLVRERRPLQWAQRRFVVAMMVTGMTLGLLLWPQAAATAQLPALRLITVVVIVAVTLISVTLAALPAGRDAMLASFWATTCAIVLMHPAQIPLGFVLVVTLMLAGIRMYAASAGRHIVSAAAILVENRRLSEDLASALAHAEFLGSRDPLTGLLNRRRLFEEGGEYAGIARQVLTIDFDHFKAINDRFGHAAGDHVLIAGADAVRALVASLPGSGHRAFRLGGEEFCVILSGIDYSAACTAAEALRALIARVGAELVRYPGLAVTASVGIAEWHPEEKLDEVLLRSDLACYDAKSLGRNRVAAAA